VNVTVAPVSAVERLGEGAPTVGSVCTTKVSVPLVEERRVESVTVRLTRYVPVAVGVQEIVRPGEGMQPSPAGELCQT
jgi:hypothetical protein